MEFIVETILVIISDDSVVIKNDELPIENVSENNIKDTAAIFFKKITGIEPITEYSGWIFLENTGWHDGVLRQREGKKIISFVYTAFLPEKIKLIDEEYKWKKISMETIQNLKHDHSTILKLNLK